MAWNKNSLDAEDQPNRDHRRGKSPQDQTKAVPVTFEAFHLFSNEGRLEVAIRALLYASYRWRLYSYI